MHGLTEHEEIDYWRKRCEQAERELAKYEAVVQAAREWRKCFDDDGEIVNRPRLGDVEVALTDAIDALDSKEQSR